MIQQLPPTFVGSTNQQNKGSNPPSVSLYPSVSEQLNYSSLVSMPPPQPMTMHPQQAYIQHPPTTQFQLSNSAMIPKQAPAVPMPMGNQSTVIHTYNPHIDPKFIHAPPSSCIQYNTNSFVSLPVQQTAPVQGTTDFHVQYVPFYFYYPVPVPCASKTAVTPTSTCSVEPVQEHSGHSLQAVVESEISLGAAKSEEMQDDMEACEAGSLHDNKVT